MRRTRRLAWLPVLTGLGVLAALPADPTVASTLRNVSFASGASLPRHYYQSIAVDPGLIPLGSRVYVPAYRGDGHGGWFVAQDTGGAISGRHIDVFRPPPTISGGPGQELTCKRIYVIRPGR